MNLVYVWFEKCRCFQKKGFILNNNYSVKQLRDYEFEIRREEKYSLYKNDKIIDSYMLLGKNGTGKSTLLEILSLNDYSPIKSIEGKYFLIYEENDEYYVLFSPFCLPNMQCKINEKEFICQYNKSGFDGTGIFLDKKKKLNIMTALGRHKNDHFQYITLNYNNREHFFSQATNLNIFNFIYREAEFLKFEQDRELIIKYNEARSEHRTSDNVSFGDTDKYRLDIEGNSRLEVIRFFFFEIYMDICDINFIGERLKEELKIKNVVKSIDKIKKEDDLIDYSIKVIEGISKIDPNVENAYRYCKRYKHFVKGLMKLDFIKNRGSDLFFCLNDITDENINDVRAFVELTNYVFLEPRTLFELRAGTSDGERAYIEILANIYTVIERFNAELEENNCYLFLDEIEQSLHPEWCRLLYFRICELINKTSIKHKYYIYISTHSPYMISDFTHDHVISMEKEKLKLHTFGANIYDILSEGMFLSNSMGEFAYQNISRLLKYLNTESELDINNVDENKIEYEIDCIGEPIIKSQLKLLYENRMKYKSRTVFKTDKINKIEEYSKMSKEELIALIMRGEND